MECCLFSIATCPEAFQTLFPKTILAQLRESFRSNVQNSLLLTAELLKLVELFAASRINAIPFKGPVLAAAVYKDLSLRQFSDLDVLVQPGRHPQSRELACFPRVPSRPPTMALLGAAS